MERQWYPTPPMASGHTWNSESSPLHGSLEEDNNHLHLDFSPSSDPKILSGTEHSESLASPKDIELQQNSQVIRKLADRRHSSLEQRTNAMLDLFDTKQFKTSDLAAGFRLAKRSEKDFDFYKRKGQRPIPYKYLLVYIAIAVVKYGSFIYTRNDRVLVIDGELWGIMCFFALIDAVIFFTYFIDFCRMGTSPGEKRSCILKILPKGEIKKMERIFYKFRIGIVCMIIFFLYSAAVCWLMISVALKEESLKNGEHLVFTLGITCDILQALLLIDYLDAFHVIMRIAASIEPYKFAILSINLFLMVLVMISLQISDSQDEDALVDSREVDAAELVVLWPITVLSAIIFFAHWDLISFTIANSEYALSLIYFTIFGGVFTWVARRLHSPDQYKKPSWAWHLHSSSAELTLHYMILFSFLFTLAVPLGGGILLAMFAQFANSLENVVSTGISVALVVLLFMIIAHCMMIIPTAPASVIDISGGFIFTQIFMKQGMRFAGAIALTLFLLIGSHFTGSCLQWYLGRMPFVQGWLNRVTPVSVLAMLDSALQESSSWKVGIYCSVAPDTIAGFAQGRSNLSFCVQFWAEYSAIPNAICTTLIGSALSQKDIRFLVPILLMITVVVNLALGAYAVKEIAVVLVDDVFILSTVKWKMVQHMMKTHGYTPTKEGWKRDIWQLATKNGLFENVFFIYKAKVKYLKGCKDPQKRQNAMEYFDNLLEEYEDEHISRFSRNSSTVLREEEENKYLVHNKSHIEALSQTSPWVYDPKRPGFVAGDHIVCIYPSNRLRTVKQDEFKILSIDREGSLQCEYVKNRTQRSSSVHKVGAKISIPIDRFEKFREVNTFFSRNRKKVQIVIFAFMYFTMVGSYFVFSVDTNETVEKGMRVVTENPYFQIGMVCLTLHTACACFYFGTEISDAFSSLCQSFSNIFCGRVSMVVEKSLETCFDTPAWPDKDRVSSERAIAKIMSTARTELMDPESPNPLDNMRILVTPQETLVERSDDSQRLFFE